jgi:DNA-directed RNA polymerase specialized sigma24 family protein
MNDAQMAADLRAKSPDALAELFDVYGDRLFLYCWLMLRHRDIAQGAVRDTIVAAETHIARLTDPDSLCSWLYSLARTECRRGCPVPPFAADEPPAGPGQRDADSRLAAWNAATSMAPEDLEVLDLACRHDVDVPLVLGLTAGDAQALADQATQNLERALGAEILVSRGGRGCPDWAQVMTGWSETMTPQTRDRVLGHAAGCPVCGPALPRNVSAARVFALLPTPGISPQARQELLDYFAEHRPCANQPGQRPEPLRSGPGPQTQTGLRLTRAGRILVAAGAVAAAAIASVFLVAGAGSKPGADRMSRPAASAAQPVLAGPAGAVGAAGGGVRRAAVSLSPRPSPADSTVGNDQALIADVTKPLSSPKTAAHGSGSAGAAGTGPALGVTPARPAPAGTLAVAPGLVAMGTGNTGQIMLTAVGGPVSWSVSTSSAQLGLSSEEGTLQAGDSVTLEVTIIRGPQGGTAAVSVEPPASAPQTVEVSWAPLPPDPSPSPSSSPSPSPSTSPSTSPSPSAS